MGLSGRQYLFFFLRALRLARGEARGTTFNFCHDHKPSKRQSLTSPASLYQACLGTNSWRKHNGKIGHDTALRKARASLLSSEPPHTPPSVLHYRTHSEEKNWRCIIAMIYSIIKRIPGSQGTKVCRVVWHVFVLGNQGDMRGSVRGRRVLALQSTRIRTDALTPPSRTGANRDHPDVDRRLPPLLGQAMYVPMSRSAGSSSLPPSLPLCHLPSRVYPTYRKAYTKAFFWKELFSFPLSQSTYLITVCGI